MRNISRRKAIRTVAASLAATASTAALGAKAQGQVAGEAPFAVKPAPDGKAAPVMTLEEFQTLNGTGSVARLFGKLKCGSFTKCHKAMRRDHGIWIPELVPVFAKLDTMVKKGL